MCYDRMICKCEDACLLTKETENPLGCFGNGDGDDWIGLLFWLGRFYVKLFAGYFLCINFLWHDDTFHEREVDYFTATSWKC